MRTLPLLYRFVIVIALQSTLFTQAGAQNKQSITGFTEIEVFGKVNLRLEKSDSAFIKLAGDSATIANIKYDIKNNTLTIKQYSSLTGDIKTDITVGVTTLTRIDAGGGCKVYNFGGTIVSRLEIEARSGTEMDLNITTDTTQITTNKGSFVRLSGKSALVNLKTSTGGDYHALELENQHLTVKMNGGTAEVNTTETITGSVNFGAKLFYKTTPKTIAIKGGSQSVQKYEE